MRVVDWVGSEKQHFLQTSDLRPKGANTRRVLWPLTGPVCVLAEGPWPYAGPTLRRLVSEFMFTAQNMTKLFQTKQTNKNNATIKIWTKHDVWFSLALQWKYYWKWRPIVFLIEIGSKRNCSGNNCYWLESPLLGCTMLARARLNLIIIHLNLSQKKSYSLPLTEAF